MKFVIPCFFLPAFLSHVLLESIRHTLIKQSTASRFSSGSPPGFLKSLFLVSILSLLTLSILHELRKFAITSEDGLAKIKLNEHKKAPNLLPSKL